MIARKVTMKAINMRSCLYVLLLTFCVNSGAAQNYTPDDIKIALVAQFIKNIEWPNASNDKPFILLVPKDKKMMAALSTLSGEVINQRKISVKYADDLKKLPAAELVYFSSNINADINQAISLLRGKGTLVVTENSSSLHNVMINIVAYNTDRSGNTESYQFKFQINRPNILYEKLSIKPELILHGGSELDMADLYRETEVAMQALRSSSEDTQKLLALKQKQLSLQSAELARLEEKFYSLANQLNSNSKLLEEQKQLLAESRERVVQVNEEYQRAKSAAKEKLLVAEKDLVLNQVKVTKQLELLKELEQQVSQKTKLLTLKEQNLQIASESLEQKSLEVADQAKKIDRQTSIIASSVITLVVFIFTIIIISKLFFKNRRIAERLQHTVDELNATQEQLIESEKLASLGQLVTGVAHEINTPIGVVVTSSSAVGDDARLYLRLLEEKKLKRNDIYQFLNTLIDTDKLIQSNLERCSRLIQNFKQVSADQVVAENRNIYLKSYISDIMGALTAVLKQNKVTWRVEGDNPMHLLDPGLLGQVINNLVANANAHAFEGINHKEFVITVIHTELFDEIIFKDNGKGMDEQTKVKIFDPFFTTKRGQGGTGLGMNIVYNLVTTKLDGKITIESEPGQGTAIIIKLPVNNDRNS